MFILPEDAQCGHEIYYLLGNRPICLMTWVFPFSRSSVVGGRLPGVGSVGVYVNVCVCVWQKATGKQRYCFCFIPKRKLTLFVCNISFIYPWQSSQSGETEVRARWVTLNEWSREWELVLWMAPAMRRIVWSEITCILKAFGSIH